MLAGKLPRARAEPAALGSSPFTHRETRGRRSLPGRLGALDLAGEPRGTARSKPSCILPCGKGSGIVCGWDRGIFGPWGLSGQSPSAGVSVTASDRQWGRLIGDKVLQKKIITRGCLRPGQSRRSEDTVWLRFSSGTCWNTPSHAALAERGPCARAWGQERQSWSHCLGVTGGGKGVAAAAPRATEGLLPNTPAAALPRAACFCKNTAQKC